MKNRGPNNLTVIVGNVLTGMATGPNLHSIWAAPSLPYKKMKGPGQLPAGRYYPTSGAGMGAKRELAGERPSGPLDAAGLWVHRSQGT